MTSPDSSPFQLESDLSKWHHFMYDTNRIHPAQGEQSHHQEEDSPQRPNRRPDSSTDQSSERPLVISTPPSSPKLREELLLPMPEFSSSPPQFVQRKSSQSKSHSPKTVEASFLLDSVAHLPEHFQTTNLRQPRLLRLPTTHHSPSPNHSSTHGPTKSTSPLKSIPTSDSIEGSIPTDLFHGSRLSIKIITFNMNGKPIAEPDRLSFMRPNAYHIYVFASQECERSIEMSFFNSKKKQWMSTLSELFSEDYEFVSCSNQLAMHMTVLVKKPLQNYISNIESHKVSCGWKNAGNKGGLLISFNFGLTRLMFINCHLAAHQNNVQERAADYHRIMRKARYHGKVHEESRRSNEKHSYQQYQMFRDMDYIFLAGDLNFRLDASRSHVDKALRNFEHNRNHLLDLDQLKKLQEEGIAFRYFHEAPIHFSPTYKLDKYSTSYDSSEKQRVPSYTDRILYYSNPKKKENDLSVQEYSSVTNCQFLGSDHHPVVLKSLITVQLSRQSNNT